MALKQQNKPKREKKNQIVYTTIDGFIGQKGNCEMSIDKKKERRSKRKRQRERAHKNAIEA